MERYVSLSRTAEIGQKVIDNLNEQTDNEI